MLTDGPLRLGGSASISAPESGRPMMSKTSLTPPPSFERLAFVLPYRISSTRSNPPADSGSNFAEWNGTSSSFDRGLPAAEPACGRDER
jgi:hypothetical protein